jgi:hypothetical protein
MAYVFRGTNKYVPPVKPLTFDESKCGTRAGYRQHQNHGIYICTACRKANTEYMKTYYKERRTAA